MAVCATTGPLGCGIYTGLKTYAVTGSLGAGLRAGVIAYASARAFQKIGDHYSDLGNQNWMDGMANGGKINHLVDFGGNLLTPAQVAGQISAHALTGGVISTLSGGKFGHGFFSAGVTKGLGTPLSHNFGQGVVSGTLTQMVIGGTASVISGGKFANGARTAAYQALFNHFRGNPNFRQIFSDVRRTFGGYLDWLKFEQATSAIDAASTVLKDGQAFKMDGCAGFYLGACASLSITNDSVIFSRGVGRLFGASIGAGYVPFNADKTNGVTSWSSGVSVPLLSTSFELDYTKGSQPQLDVMVAGALCFSINHTLMYHSVYTPRGK